MTSNAKSVIDDFHTAVNMTADELTAWLETEESLVVGQKKDDDESIGHKSGRCIVEILQKSADEYTDDDLKHMNKVISYVRRHLAERPAGEIEHTRWRYSLKNWGHEPMNNEQ